MPVPCPSRLPRITAPTVRFLPALSISPNRRAPPQRTANHIEKPSKNVAAGKWTTRLLARLGRKTGKPPHQAAPQDASAAFGHISNGDDHHGQVPAPPSSARGRHLPQRRRHGDDADLSRRRRAPAFRVLRPARDRDGQAAFAALLRALSRDRARQPASASCSTAPSWRANPDWGAKLGYDADGAQARSTWRRSSCSKGCAQKWETPATPCVIGGAIGPRGDGYKAGMMDAAEAEDYHALQVAPMPGPRPTWSSAYTMNNIDEAVGVARAARAHRHALHDLVHRRDRRQAGHRQLASRGDRDRRRATDGYPLYYMINCAHPTHFTSALRAGEAWLDRVYGVKANASTKSHAELDEFETLDAGDPVDLGRRYGGLRRDRSRPCGSSAAAAAPTTATSPRSAKPACRSRR